MLARTRSAATVTLSAVLALGGLGALGCGPPSPETGERPSPHHEGHVHAAPHGGLLVELAHEAAYLEVVFDRATGGLTLFVLGAHADTPVRISAPALDVHLEVDGATFTLSLDAVGSPLTGETPGDSSEFTADDPRLVTSGRIEGRIPRIDVRGVVFDDVRFEL